MVTAHLQCADCAISYIYIYCSQQALEEMSAFTHAGATLPLHQAMCGTKWKININVVCFASMKLRAFCHISLHAFWRFTHLIHNAHTHTHIMQPIISIFRCKPDSIAIYRWMFNLIHGSMVGWVAVVLASEYAH